MFCNLNLLECPTCNFTKQILFPYFQGRCNMNMGNKPVDSERCTNQDIYSKLHEINDCLNLFLHSHITLQLRYTTSLAFNM